MMTYESALVHKNKHICWEMTCYSSEVNSCHFSLLHGDFDQLQKWYNEKKTIIQLIAGQHVTSFRKISIFTYLFESKTIPL